jgi:peptidoglycan-associated lipoprotein
VSLVYKRAGKFLPVSLFKSTAIQNDYENASSIIKLSPLHQEDLMWGSLKNNTLLLAVILGLLIASGCSGLGVKYGANSNEDGMISNEDGTTNELEKRVNLAHGAIDGSGTYGGAVDSTNPYLYSNKANSREEAGGNPEQSLKGNTAGSVRSSDFPSSNSKTMERVDGITAPGGSNYGHSSAGVDGSGPHHGPISGFGSGLAASSQPDPESWANAYLGNNQTNREFYGDPSKAGTSSSGSPSEAVNPAAWAESYMRENGGPSPEYVNPDLNIARANSQQGGGSVAIGKTNRNELLFESNFRDTWDTGKVQDIYFAFDSWSISRDAADFLEEGAKWLQANPGKALTIEGHCDQRGTQDYNLVLGQKRADAAREYLINLGVQPDRIKIVSYGKERPFCQGLSEECFRENRRNHMVVRVN